MRTWGKGTVLQQQTLFTFVQIDGDFLSPRVHH